MAKNNKKSNSESISSEEVKVNNTKSVKDLVIDLDLNSEFITQEGAEFSRFQPQDFYKFSKHIYFDNLTSPFSSYSYSVESEKLINSKLILALDNTGLWFYLSYKESEHDESKNKVLVNTHNYLEGLSFINTLPLQISIGDLKELGILK